MNSSLQPSGNALNLRRVLWLRLIILSAGVIAVWIAVKYWHLHISSFALLVILGAMIVISIASYIRLFLRWPVTDIELFSQLLLDVLALTAVLYFTGGSTNPFAPFYLLPLTLTAVSLPGFYTWVMMLFTLGCYTLLLFYNVPMPAMHGGHGTDFRLHEMGMWFGFLLSAIIIAGFAVKMSATVRNRDKKIAELRAQQLHQEHILALGTLAAGAAHELGTPLSTMAVLLNDMDAEQVINDRKLQTLRDQVKRCKTILGSLSAAAGEIRAESGSAQPLDQFLTSLLQDWLKSRTEIQIQYELTGTKPAPEVIIDQTITQAILNILNNAADASPDDVRVDAGWTEDELRIDVADRGEGLSSDLLSQAGKSIRSTKKDGLGLGLFLSYTTLQRLGGDVQLLDRDEGGTLCRIILPLKNLTLPVHE